MADGVIESGNFDINAFCFGAFLRLESVRNHLHLLLKSVL